MSFVPRKLDFLVVGAQKAGTTTLHEWLSTHSELALPTIKETHYFRDADKFNNGPEWYFRWFPSASSSRLHGEVDPEYLYFSDSIDRIKAMFGDGAQTIAFVFVFREPLARSYSHYQMSVRRGLEHLDFPAALEAESRRLAVAESAGTTSPAHIHHSYFSRSCYAGQVSRFVEAFPRARRLFMRFDDIADPTTAPSEYARLCSFLGVEAQMEQVDFTKKSNPASRPRFGQVRDLLYGQSALKRTLGRVIPSKKLKLKIAMAVDRLNQSPVLDHEKTSDWRSAVPDQYWAKAYDEITALEVLTGLNLETWKKLEGYR